MELFSCGLEVRERRGHSLWEDGNVFKQSIRVQGYA